MLYNRRKKFDSVSNAIGKFASKLGISPNTWTMISLVPGLATFYFIYSGQFLFALITYPLTAVLDVIDGAVARYIGEATRKGAYLDTIVDRFIEAFIIFGFLFVPFSVLYFSLPVWILALVFGSMMATYAKAASAEKGVFNKGHNGIKGGLMEHTDRMISFFIIIALLAFDQNMYASYLLMITVAFSNLTAMQRIFYAISRA